jgi:hypothetical protein
LVNSQYIYVFSSTWNILELLMMVWTLMRSPRSTNVSESLTLKLDEKHLKYKISFFVTMLFNVTEK